MRLPPYYDQPRFHTSLLWSTTTSAITDDPESTNAAPTSPNDGPMTITLPSNDPQTPRTEAPPSPTSLPFSATTVAALEAQLGRALRDDEFYVAEVCLKVGKEVKVFPLAG